MYPSFTGTQFVLHHGHCICQIIKLLLQALNPHGISPSVQFTEGQGHFQIHYLLILLGDYLLEIQDHLQVDTDPCIKSVHNHPLGSEVHIDVTEDLPGIGDTCQADLTAHPEPLLASAEGIR